MHTGQDTPKTAVTTRPYTSPALTELGTLHELTLGCDKTEGGSDGFTFHGTPITCTSA